MTYSLLNIARSGVRANTELLQTTSKNIANVNTAGYVRERTEHATMINNQVGRGDTTRLLNEFAQKQVNRDTSNRAFFEQLSSEALRVDKQFSEQSNNLSTRINSLFNNVQEALNQPSSGVGRSLFFADADNFINQLNRLSGSVLEQKSLVNDQLSTLSEQANGLVQKISDLNNQITAIHRTQTQASGSSVYNERDKAIRDLAELIDIETLDGPHGEKLVFMGTGEALVMENGSFNLFSLQGDPDPNHKALVLDVTQGNANRVELNPSQVKGKIGGVLAFRDEVLVPSQNKLGQLALSMADAFNQQNQLGMNGTGNLGKPLFTLPSVNGLAYQANTGSASLSASLEAGQGKQLTATDFAINFTSPTTVEITPLDNKGNPVGSPSTANVVAGVINAGTVTAGEAFGLEMNISGAANTGDQFVVKLNSHASTHLELATRDPNELALASPIRTKNELNNTGTAKISAGVVTNTGVGANFSGTPPVLTNGTISLVKTANPNEYTVSDTSGSVTFTATPPTNNVLAQAGAPFSTYGFDFNIEGEPAAGDTFTLEFNTDGFDDNRNGLALAQLQQSALVRQSAQAPAAGNNLSTTNQAFANVVSNVGITTQQAQTSHSAFQALEEQSTAWYESLSGVNLDEEAANLLRFQQSYAASAQVLSAAQSVFDTLLSAAR